MDRSSALRLGTGPSSGASNVVVPAILPVLTPGSAGITEGDRGPKTLQLPVTLSAASPVPVTVQWSTVDGVGQPAVGVDYVAASGMLTFAPGQTAKTVPVTVLGDMIDEPNEMVSVELSGATNAAIGGYGGIGFVVILDNDPRPLVEPGGVGVNPEGDSGSAVWRLPVTLSAPSGFPVTVRWATLNGGVSPGLARPGRDFVLGSGMMTFLPGETVKEVPLTILGDTLDDPPLLYGEWGMVAFSSPTNATVDVNSGLYGFGLFIIVDDDP